MRQRLIFTRALPLRRHSRAGCPHHPHARPPTHPHTHTPHDERFRRRRCGCSGGGSAAGAVRAETARQALLLATQALGVNAAAVREACEERDWLLAYIQRRPGPTLIGCLEGGEGRQGTRVATPSGEARMSTVSGRARGRALPLYSPSRRS